MDATLSLPKAISIQNPLTYRYPLNNYAAVTSLSFNSHFPSCNFFNASFPSSVSSGFPSGVVDPVKNLGCHAVPASSRDLAFCLCRSSISCFKVVARENCRDVMASVTPDQKRRDSLGSCSFVGGRDLGATESGERSTMSVWVSYDRQTLDGAEGCSTYKFWSKSVKNALFPVARYTS